ncbi:phage tail spike protein, partial [Ligilactobacillus agilis]|uniref:phage tail spike protein n=1 Tax=Ligilactobacillus agilis TaxID=1601 RepID=UPI003F8C6A97
MQIYILNRARETLATTASIYNDKHTLTLEAGSSSYEFTIDKSDEASHYLDSGNYVVLQDDKGKTWLFTILDYEETHNTKTVYAEDAGIELINKAVDIWKGDGPHPFSYYFDLVTKGTPWKLGVNQLAGLERTLTYEGRDTGLGRLLSILKGFDDAECTFDVTVKMNAPAEFKINVYKQVGNDRSDVQIVYNNELNDITKKESRAEFVTALAGVGGQIQTEDGSEGGNIDFSELEYDKDGFVTKKGDKFLRAVDANRTFNPGQESYIESFYEYDTQSPSELLNRTLSKLKTYSEPQYTYTADVKVIDSSLVLGDTVTILDHDYNPALYLSARVAKLVKSYTDPAQNEIEFTNYRLLNSALADKLARLQVIVNTLPSASRVSAIETNLTKLTKQQEEVIVKVESANGKNTNYYGGSQPESAKQGDSWFYTDEEGNQGIKQYQDGVWVDVISSKFGPKLEADIKQTQDDMQGLSDEVEEARSKAQEAFAKAGFNADEISNVKTATSEVAETLTSTVRQASELSESLKNVASETASRYNTVSSELSGTRESLNAKASELASKVASNSANITKANSQLYSQSEGLAKVSQSATKMEQTMTDLSGRVHTVETTASETKEALADAKGNIATLTKRADGTDTKIADAQGRVQTLESRADSWDLELSKKVDNTTYNAGIQNLGNQINLKANKSDLDGYATKAQLSVESGRITQQAGEIVTVRNLANAANNKIDGLRIGGRNLLKGTSDQFKTISNSGWMWTHTWTNNDN